MYNFMDSHVAQGQVKLPGIKKVVIKLLLFYNVRTKFRIFLLCLWKLILVLLIVSKHSVNFKFCHLTYL